MGIRRASETYCKTLINLKISTAVHSHQKRKSKGILKMFYIKLCFVMVMVAYTMANPVETRRSSGANQVQDRKPIRTGLKQALAKVTGKGQRKTKNQDTKINKKPPTGLNPEPNQPKTPTGLNTEPEIKLHTPILKVS